MTPWLLVPVAGSALKRLQGRFISWTSQRSAAALVFCVEPAELVGVIRLLGAALTLRRMFPLLLTIATQSSERHRLEALLADVESAHLAQAVFQRRDSPERVVDLPDLESLTLKQHAAHLALILFRSQIAAVHTIVSAGVSPDPNLSRDFPD